MNAQDTKFMNKSTDPSGQKTVGVILLVCGIACALAPLAVAYQIFAANVPTDPAYYLLARGMAITALAGAMATILLYPILFFFASIRQHVNRLVLIAIAIVAATAAALNGCCQLESAAYASIIVKAEPLIGAIRNYEKHNKKSPESLQRIVPEYLGAIPDTGLKYWPAYEYRVFKDKPFTYHRWEVAVRCNTTVMSPARLFYWPTEKYPDLLNDRLVTKIRSWGYVNED